MPYSQRWEVGEKKGHTKSLYLLLCNRQQVVKPNKCLYFCCQTLKHPTKTKIYKFQKYDPTEGIEGSIRVMLGFLILNQELKPPKYSLCPRHTMNMTLAGRHPNGHYHRSYYHSLRIWLLCNKQNILFQLKCRQFHQRKLF